MKVTVYNPEEILNKGINMNIDEALVYGSTAKNVSSALLDEELNKENELAKEDDQLLELD